MPPGSRSTPRPSSWASATCRSTRRRGLNLIPNSPIVRETYGLDDARPAATALAEPIVDTAIPYDAVWDCVTCGACVEACPVLIEHVDKIVGLRRNLVLEESRFPQELTPAFRAMEGQGNPWGQPASARLDWTKPLPFEVRTVASVAGSRRARRARGPVLGGLRRGVRSAQPEGGQGGRDVPARRRCLVRGPRAGGVVHRRPGPADGQRLRVPDPGRWRGRDPEPLRHGRADDRDRLPALLQHDRQRVRAAGRGVPRSSTTRSSWPSWCRPAGSRRCRRTRPRRPATTGRGA